MKIKLELSKNGIDKALKELEDYKNSLDSKLDQFVQRLTDIGLNVVEQKIGEAYEVDDKLHMTEVRMTRMKEYAKATLVVSGKTILFIEFGAGVHHNGAVGTSPHPKGGEFGYTIGSYGLGHGKQDSWTYFTDSGEWVITHGTKATMPVYNASVKMREEMVKIAKEVFG